MTSGQKNACPQDQMHLVGGSMPLFFKRSRLALISCQHLMFGTGIIQAIVY